MEGKIEGGEDGNRMTMDHLQSNCKIVTNGLNREHMYLPC